MFSKNEGIDINLTRNVLNYTQIYDLIAINSCQVELEGKDIVLLSNITVILNKASLRRGIEDLHVKFTLSSGIYPIDFNEEVKALLQKRED